MSTTTPTIDPLYETADAEWMIQLAGSDAFNIFAYGVVLWMIYTVLTFALEEAFGEGGSTARGSGCRECGGAWDGRHEDLRGCPVPVVADSGEAE